MEWGRWFRKIVYTINCPLPKISLKGKSPGNVGSALSPTLFLFLTCVVSTFNSPQTSRRHVWVA